ncbi:response regulator [Roseomonas soli]|uniref:histidine kinase n=1 Tax=Neoroseomonas soli TaxID=1081025 RepID=A0A9X9X2R5_9PROT|nr:response regulator [Neoroseomonas soli]
MLLRPGTAGGPPAAIGAEQPLRQAIARGDRRAMIGDPFADGAPQVLAWARVGDYPLYLVHTLPLTAMERRRLDTNLLICLALAALLGLLALRTWGGQRRDDDALDRLEANAAELRAEIARREAAEESLRNAQRLEGLGRLTGGVAHDFNNLLTAILGTARALERHLGERADERTKRLIAATVTAVDRGARLNASLLAFARRQPLTLTSVDANALLRDFLPLLRRALDESITVELALDQKLPTCSADAAQLEAALLNLAINARDAMPRGGKLRIVTRRAWLQEQALAGNADAQPGPYVAIEVRDTGQGMVPEVRERAFEPFFTTKDPGQGTGLGLSQVFGFVRQIGGHVAIQSAPGRGTTVSLYLPLGSATDAGAGAGAGGSTAPARHAAHSGAGLSVLVVEDEPVVRAVAVDMLQDAGFAVLAAQDGPTALALLEEGAQVDILFSDVVMPGGMTGVDLARAARRLRPEIGVLLASGYAAEVLAQHGGAGEFELIDKPYDVETVLTRIAAQRPQPAAAAQWLSLRPARAQ